jgi:TRAP-type C4-dicarboxylate transport system permease small subunit
MQKELKMNKMHTLAKIILSAIGIFFAIRLLSQLPFAVFYFRLKPSWETVVSSLLSLLLIAGLITLLLYFFFYKNESLAKKIVGSEQLPEPSSQIQWLPVVLRLVCIAGGFYFVITVLWHITYVINELAFFKAQENAHTIYTHAHFKSQDLLPWIITLICGIYLLCGAPHFVRWHVKKILQQCKDRPENT